MADEPTPEIVHSQADILPGIPHDSFRKAMLVAAMVIEGVGDTPVDQLPPPVVGGLLHLRQLLANLPPSWGPTSSADTMQPAGPSPPKETEIAVSAEEPRPPRIKLSATPPPNRRRPDTELIALDAQLNELLPPGQDFANTTRLVINGVLVDITDMDPNLCQIYGEMAVLDGLRVSRMVLAQRLMGLVGITSERPSSITSAWQRITEPTDDIMALFVESKPIGIGKNRLGARLRVPDQIPEHPRIRLAPPDMPDGAYGPEEDSDEAYRAKLYRTQAINVHGLKVPVADLDHYLRFYFAGLQHRAGRVLQSIQTEEFVPPTYTIKAVLENARNGIRRSRPPAIQTYWHFVSLTPDKRKSLYLLAAPEFAQACMDRHLMTKRLEPGSVEVPVPEGTVARSLEELKYCEESGDWEPSHAP